MNNKNMRVRNASHSRQTPSCLSLSYTRTHHPTKNPFDSLPGPVLGLSALIDDAQPVLQRPRVVVDGVHNLLILCHSLLLLGVERPLMAAISVNTTV